MSLVLSSPKTMELTSEGPERVTVSLMFIRPESRDIVSGKKAAQTGAPRVALELPFVSSLRDSILREILPGTPVPG